MVPSDGTGEDPDPSHKGANNKKWLVSEFPFIDDVVEGVTSTGVRQEFSFHDSVLRNDAMQVENLEDDGGVSDDDVKEREEDPDCPTIYLTKKEKAALDAL